MSFLNEKDESKFNYLFEEITKILKSKIKNNENSKLYQLSLK